MEISALAQAIRREKIEKVKSSPGHLIWHFNTNISRGENRRRAAEKEGYIF